MIYNPLKSIFSLNEQKVTEETLPKGTKMVASVSFDEFLKKQFAVQELAKTYDWFSKYIKDARMLRIEDDFDLMPAISK